MNDKYDDAGMLIRPIVKFECSMDNEQLQIRMGEMAAEIDRLQSVIDEANAQEPYAVACGAGKAYVKSDFSDIDSFLRTCRKNTPLYKLPIPGQQSVDRDTIINVILSAGNMSEGVIADAIISAIGAKQSPAVAVPDEEPRDNYADDYTKAFRCWWNDCREEMLRNIAKSSPRITEQDAREIAMSAWRYWMNGCGRTIDTWIEEEWPNVLNKINGDQHGK